MTCHDHLCFTLPLPEPDQVRPFKDSFWQGKFMGKVKSYDASTLDVRAKSLAPAVGRRRRRHRPGKRTRRLINFWKRPRDRERGAWWCSACSAGRKKISVGPTSTVPNTVSSPKCSTLHGLSTCNAHHTAECTVYMSTSVRRPIILCAWKFYFGQIQSPRPRNFYNGGIQGPSYWFHDDSV